MIGKRGKLTMEQIVGIILGGAVVFLLAVLLFSVLLDGWNKEEETTKSYFNTLKEGVEKADDGGVGNFNIWQGDKTFVIYFGNHRSFSYTFRGGSGGVSFIDFLPSNTICVCDWDMNLAEFNCLKKYCLNLEKPANSALGAGKEQWFFGKGSEVFIKDEGDKYFFGGNVVMEKLEKIENAKKEIDKFEKLVEDEKEEARISGKGFYMVSSGVSNLYFRYNNLWEFTVYDSEISYSDIYLRLVNEYELVRDFNLQGTDLTNSEKEELSKKASEEKTTKINILENVVEWYESSKDSVEEIDNFFKIDPSNSVMECIQKVIEDKKALILLLEGKSLEEGVKIFEDINSKFIKGEDES